VSFHGRVKPLVKCEFLLEVAMDFLGLLNCMKKARANHLEIQKGLLEMGLPELKSESLLRYDEAISFLEKKVAISLGMLEGGSTTPSSYVP